jgi:hypothetical protein
MKPENQNKNINLPPTLDTPAQEVVALKDGIIAAANLPDMTKDGLNRLTNKIIDRLTSIADSRELLIAEMRAIQSKSGLYHNVGTNLEKINAHTQLIDATKTAIQNKLNTPEIATEININQFVDSKQIPQYSAIKEVVMTGLKDAYQIGFDSNGKLVGFDQETQSPMSIVFKGTQMILTPNGEGIEDTSALKRFIVSDVFNKLAKQQKLDLSSLKNIEQSTQMTTQTAKPPTISNIKNSNPTLTAPLEVTEVTPAPSTKPITPTTPASQPLPQVTPITPRPTLSQYPAPIPKQVTSAPDSIPKPTTTPLTKKPNTESKQGSYKSDPNRLKKDKLKALNWSKFTDFKVFPDNKVMLIGIDKSGNKSVQIISSSNKLLIQDYRTLSDRQRAANTNSKPELDQLPDDNTVIDLITVPEINETKSEQMPTSTMFDEYLEFTKVNLSNPNSLLNNSDLTFGFTQLADEIYYNFYSPSPESKENQATDKATYTQNLAEAQRLAKFDPNLTSNNGSWQYANIGNFNKLKKEDTGRIYFNIEPQEAPLLYNKLVEKLKAENLVSQIKIPSSYQDRPDCAVLYFDQAQQMLIQNIISEIVGSNKFTFRDELGKGQHPISKGIGFAQEPSIPIINGAKFSYNSEGQISFGEKISWIMGVVLSNIKSQNLDQVKDKDKINLMYTTLMEKHGIDPNNPAFYNENSKFESFKTFKV